MSDLGLNTTHEEEVRKYLKFARYNRNQQKRSIDGCFSDLKESRLNDDTYTLDEVEEMIDGLQKVVCSSVESELINDAHTNVLLLVQLFSQAEKWHLKLQSDISELENQKLLKEIAEFEKNEESGGGKSKPLQLSNLSQKSKLQPLNEGGSTALLQMEIQRLQEENEVLKNKFINLEKSALGGSKEASRLRSDLERAREEGKKNNQGIPNDSNEVNLLSDKISSLSGQLMDAEEVYQRKCSSLEEEVTNSKHYVLALQHEIETLSEEFDKKFSETTQFKNLKKMLEGKNGQLKELRKRLKKYEPDHEL